MRRIALRKIVWILGVPQKVCYGICFMECLSDSQIILYEQECFQSCSKECFTNDKIMQKPCVLMCIFRCLKHPDNPLKQADPLSYLYPLFLHFHMHIFISIPWQKWGFNLFSFCLFVLRTHHKTQANIFYKFRVATHIEAMPVFFFFLTLNSTKSLFFIPKLKKNCFLSLKLCKTFYFRFFSLRLLVYFLCDLTEC